MKIFTAAIIATAGAAAGAVAAVLLTRRQQPAETPAAAPPPSYFPPTMYDGQSMYGDPEAVEALFPKAPPPSIEIEEEPEPRYNRFQFRYRALNELSRIREAVAAGASSTRSVEDEIRRLYYAVNRVGDATWGTCYSVEKIAATLTPPEVAPASSCQDHPEPTPTPCGREMWRQATEDEEEEGNYIHDYLE